MAFLAPTVQVTNPSTVAGLQDSQVCPVWVKLLEPPVLQAMGVRFGRQEQWQQLAGRGLQAQMEPWQPQVLLDQVAASGRVGQRNLLAGLGRTWSWAFKFHHFRVGLTVATW
jgi:hypothetical protein